MELNLDFNTLIFSQSDIGSLDVPFSFLSSQILSNFRVIPWRPAGMYSRSWLTALSRPLNLWPATHTCRRINFHYCSCDSHLPVILGFRTQFNECFTSSLSPTRPGDSIVPEIHLEICFQLYKGSAHAQKASKNAVLTLKKVCNRQMTCTYAYVGPDQKEIYLSPYFLTNWGQALSNRVE